MCILLSGFFSSVEFYVIMAVIAASIVVSAAKPRTRGEVREFLLGSRLSADDSGAGDTGPSIEFHCLDNGHVLLYRRGLEGISTSGAVSLVAKFDGIDLSLEEREVDGSQWDPPAQEACFDIEFLPPGRYHVVYNSKKTGLFAAFSLHVHHGLVATRILSR